MIIKQISIENLTDLVILFDQYMIFYQQPSAPEKYRHYLEQRLTNNEATVFIAYNKDNKAMGFVLNYFSFSSVSLGKVVVLNDLFIASEYRKQGVAKQLINSAISFAKELGAVRVDIATAQDNLPAQALYEKMGFIKNSDFFSYNLPIQ